MIGSRTGSLTGRRQGVDRNDDREETCFLASMQVRQARTWQRVSQCRVSNVPRKRRVQDVEVLSFSFRFLYSVIHFGRKPTSSVNLFVQQLVL